MKTHFAKLLLVAFALLFALTAAAQNNKETDIGEAAEKEADRLAEMLDLSDYQLFYVDSTLKHDFKAMTDEFQKLSASGMSNSNVYITVQDKWLEIIDESYKKIFSEEQWAVYLKNGGEKQIKAREKRREKAGKRN